MIAGISSKVEIDLKIGASFGSRSRKPGYRKPRVAELNALASFLFFVVVILLSYAVTPLLYTITLLGVESLSSLL